MRQQHDVLFPQAIRTGFQMGVGATVRKKTPNKYELFGK